MPFGPSDLLWFGVLPCAVAALVMFIACRFEVRPTAAWSVSFAAGALTGMIAQQARAGLPAALEHLTHPRASIDWLPYLLLVAAALPALAAYASRTWQRPLLALTLFFTLAVPMRLLASNAAAMARWTTTEKLAILAFWTFAFAALWATLSLGRRNGQPLVRSLLAILVALGTAITLAASGSFTHFDLGVVATSALIGTTAIAFLLQAAEAGPSSAAGPLAILLLSLILLGNTYELTTVNAALLVIAIAASAGFLPLPSQNAAAAAIRITLTVIPLGLAAASAITTALANPY
jgi:hypothetical protein